MEDLILDVNEWGDLARLSENCREVSTGRLKERRQIQELLRRLAREGSLKLPFRILQREKPDFELLFSKKSIGVEVTTITSTALEQAKRLKRDPSRPCQLHVTEAASRMNRKRMNGKRLREVTIVPPFLSSQFSPPGGIGANQELKNFLDVALAKIHEKIQKARGYSQYCEMWLLLQDQLSAIPFQIDTERIEVLRRQLVGSSGPFARVFIQSEDFEALQNLV